MMKSLYIISLILMFISMIIDAIDFDNYQRLFRNEILSSNLNRSQIIENAIQSPTYYNYNDIWSLTTSEGKCNGSQFGTVPDPNDCRRYYLCSMDYAYERHCPSLTLFDYQQKQCVFYSNAECFSNEEFICPRKFALYRHQQKCDRYWICVNGKAKIKYCTLGQKFDVHTNRCRIASWARCTEQSNNNESMSTTTESLTPTIESNNTLESSTIIENDKNFTMTLTPSKNENVTLPSFDITSSPTFGQELVTNDTGDSQPLLPIQSNATDSQEQGLAKPSGGLKTRLIKTKTFIRSPVTRSKTIVRKKQKTKPKVKKNVAKKENNSIITSKFKMTTTSMIPTMKEKSESNKLSSYKSLVSSSTPCDDYDGNVDN
ncbi:hypothetical protein DERP_001757 [Dermatophagoides pteronyssinus]|uniref:Chitin-binding type-2 domain-containing protein n=1 Tax=Dermatophagoides pteronyssinus TaxID=6956 RepID=A0ABQ8JBE8_DERPT|nr:hypothetical protein DERP_001757 [Dermatophagoides pteronyssinus]